MNMKQIMLLILLALAGCSPRPIQSTLVVEDAYRKLAAQPKAYWLRIRVADRSGFERMELVAIDGREREITWVLDPKYQPLGYYTDLGTTIRLRPSGAEERLGVFPPDDSVRLILGDLPQSMEVVRAPLAERNAALPPAHKPAEENQGAGN